MSYDEDALKRELIRDEGRRLKPYRDSEGNWTIGVGHLLVGNELVHYVDLATGKARRTLSAAECGTLLIGDICDAEARLTRLLPAWRGLDAIRQRALLNLSFNLGPRLARFVNFLFAVEREDWPKATDELRDSRWWRQVKSRGPRIAHMIETGTVWEGE